MNQRHEGYSKGEEPCVVTAALREAAVIKRSRCGQRQGPAGIQLWETLAKVLHHPELCSPLMEGG